MLVIMARICSTFLEVLNPLIPFDNVTIIHYIWIYGREKNYEILAYDYVDRIMCLILKRTWEFWHWAMIPMASLAVAPVPNQPEVPKGGE